MKTAMVVVALIFSVSAGAKPVYKCEEGGQITFTDRPCAPDASPLALPDPIITAPLTRPEQDLARANEERLARERAERDRADAEWLAQHAERKEAEARKQRKPAAASGRKRRRQ
jgi:Domain of unknown function (DUF4124)